MGKPKKPEDAKAEVGANLDAWYRRNADKIKLMEDLTLDCAACKTPEAKKSIKEMTEEVLKKIQDDANKTGKANESILKEVPGIEKPDVAKKIQEEVDKKITVYQKGTTKVKIKPDGKITKGEVGVKVELTW